LVFGFLIPHQRTEVHEFVGEVVNGGRIEFSVFAHDGLSSCCANFFNNSSFCFAAGRRRARSRAQGLTTYSDGLSAHQFGNTTTFSDGVTAHQFGNTTTFSNGRNCHQFGNVFSCN
jgi:hypothetical protein